MDTFQERMKALLERKGITKYKLAKDLGKPTTTILNWINRNKTPRPKTMQKIAEYFGVTTAWLAYGDMHQAPNVKDDMMRLCGKLCEICDKDQRAYRRIKALLEYWCKLIEEEIEEKRQEAHRIIRIGVDEKIIDKRKAKRLIDIYDEEELKEVTNGN
jgi:transcriptional regulator with XRE-family HTH domain